VFQVANARTQSLHTFGEGLGQVGQKLAEWEGEAGSAFHGSLGKARFDIDADGAESAKVAAAVSASVADVQACKTMMSEIDSTAGSFGFTITPDWRVDIGNAGLLMGVTEAQLEQQILQTDLNTLNAKAHSTDQELAAAVRAAVDPGQAGAPGNAKPPADADQAARQRDEVIVNNPNASPAERQLAKERLDDLKNSKLVGPLTLDPVTGDDARTRAQGRRQFQQFLESGNAYPDRPPLTPDQATQLLDKWEAGGRQMILNDFGKQLQTAGVSGPGVQRALDEIQSGKTPAAVLRDAASNMSTYGGGLGGGAESHGKAMPNGQHWGDRPVWSEADAKALEGFGRKLTKAGVGLDAAITSYDIINGAPAGPALAHLGGRTAGGFAGGFIAGGLWGSFVGPEGTLAVGLIGGVAGSMGGDKVVDWMLGQ
jgi:hypothetical protein